MTYIMVNDGISGGYRKKAKENKTHLGWQFHFVKNKKSRQRMKSICTWNNRTIGLEKKKKEKELNAWAGSCPSISERYSFSLLKAFPVSSWAHGLLWQAKAAESNLTPGLMILCRKQFSPEGPEIRECWFNFTSHNY